MIMMKTQSIESRCYRTGKCTVCRRVRAFFSPEMLQAWAVKGLSHASTYVKEKDSSVWIAQRLKIRRDDALIGLVCL